MIRIRPATEGDIDSMMECYDAARRYMRESGNPTQWNNGYPSRELVAEDVAEGRSYVGVDCAGEIVMAFAFIEGEDPTYSVIKDGQWLNDLPYGTIHRLGSTGKCHGVFEACVDFCLTKTDNLRLDTHADNLTMQHVAEKMGFRRCGIIYCCDGTARIAYQRCREVLKHNNKD